MFREDSFFLAIDKDYDDVEYSEYGDFQDQALSNVGGNSSGLQGVFEVRDMVLGTNYLRADDVEHSFLVNLPSLFPTITYGQIIYLNFPGIYVDVLQGIQPDCKIVRQSQPNTNFAGACFIEGLRLAFFVKEDMVSGTNYWLSVYNLRNPEKNDPNM